MRRTVLHLIVALLAFLVGVATAYAFGLFFGAQKPRAAGAGFVISSDPPRRSCRGSVRSLTPPPPPPAVMVMPSAPEPAAAPEPPPAPARRSRKQTRIVVRGADGTVKVFKSEGDARVTQTESAPVTRF
ncbi:MAG TPA: hypothetical protein VER32_09340 [Pyrinomonadaceae bacterium]|nr:hypothetical protein [Pyrinomonadaceae bacterium]